MGKKEKISKLEKEIIKHNLTEQEVITAIQSAKGKPARRRKLHLSGKHVKYGYFSDAHIGHEAFKPELFEFMAKHFNKEKVEFVVDSGDHLEGMSGRPGHIYELTHIGFDSQINYAAEFFDKIKAHIYGIDGNHDQWYFKKGDAGMIVGKALEHMLSNYTHLGQDEGNLELKPGINLHLYHGADGTAYADSYKIQKLIESFDGGSKPNIIHSGHYHKSLYLCRRNIHGFESGTLCGQTRFMRGKKLQAHIGYGIVDAWIDKKGVNRIQHLWVPFYNK